MTRINKSKDGRIGPEPKPIVTPEPVPAPKTKKKAKNSKPTMKAKKTRK